MAPAKLELFRVVNDSVVACTDPKRASISLWKQNAKQLDAFSNEILQLCLELVSQPKDVLDWDKAALFLQHLSAALESQPEAWGDCMEAVLRQLAEYTYLLDATQRCRLIQLIYHVLHGCSNAEVGLDTGLLEDLTVKMQERLTDKVFPVRKIAAQTLKLLIVSEDDCLDEATEMMLERLQEEPHQDVRASILRSCEVPLPTLIQRTQDVSPVVQKEAYNRLAYMPLSAINDEPGGAAGLAWRGLRVRHPDVKQAAVVMVKSWLEDQAEGDVHELLDLLHVTQYPEACQLLLSELCEAGHLNVDQMLGEVPGGGLRPASGGQHHTSMTAAQAFTRAFACLRLQVQGADLGQKAAATSGAAATIVAADATRALDLLESVLPESVSDMLSLITDLVQAGPAHRFAALQMINLATACMDWADGSNREQGLHFLQEVLLPINPGHETSPPTSSFQGGCGWTLAGCGGTGGWEAAVVGLAVRLLPLQPSGQAFAACMLDKLQQLAGQWDVAGGDGAAGRHPACHLQLLSYLEHVLTVLQSHSLWPRCVVATVTASAAAGGQGQDNAEVTWLLQQVVLPGVDVSTDVHVQCAALRVLSKLCTTASVPQASAARQPLLPHLAGACAEILLQPAADSALQEQAVTTLFDALMLHGVPAVKGAACEALQARSGNARNGLEEVGDVSRLTQQLAATTLGASSATDVVQCVVDLMKRAFLDPEKPLTRKRKKGGDGSQELHIPPSLLRACVEGCCKLLLIQDFHTALSSQWDRSLALQADETAELLKQLLVCHVHPLTRASPDTQQCLVEFLKCYSKKPSGKHALVQAFIYAARLALHIPLTTTTTKTSASPLTKHVRDLLLAEPQPAASTARRSQPGGGEVVLCWEDELAVMVVEEVRYQVCRQGKGPTGWDDYIKELAALFVATPLDTSSPVHHVVLHIARRDLQQALERPKTALGVTLTRCLKAARDHVAELAAAAQLESVTEDEVARITQAVFTHMPPAESSQPAEGAVNTRGRGAKKEPQSKSGCEGGGDDVEGQHDQDVQSADDDDDDYEEDDE